jgi:hypothetical protein
VTLDSHPDTRELQRAAGYIPHKIITGYPAGYQLGSELRDELGGYSRIDARRPKRQLLGLLLAVACTRVG